MAQNGDDTVESGVQPKHRAREERGAAGTGHHHGPRPALACAADIADYQHLIGRQENIIDLLGAPPGVEDADLQITPLRDPARPADLG